MMSSEYFDTEVNQPPERKRKHSSPRHIQQNVIDFNLGENSDSDCKSELPDFSEFVPANETIQLQGKLFENPNKGLKLCSDFDHSLITMAYEGNEENMDDGDSNLNDHEETRTRCKKMKMNFLNGSQLEKTYLMSSGDSPFNVPVSSSESRDYPTRISPNHMISATGDSGWYQVLQVKDTLQMVSTPDQTRAQHCDPKALQTINMAAIAQTTPGVQRTISQPVFSTPVCQQSSSVKSLPSNSVVYTQHPESGQVMYLTNPAAVTPQMFHTSKVQTVTPLMMNRTNMVPPYTPVSQICEQSMVNSSGDENISPKNAEKMPAHNSGTSSPEESNDPESAAYGLLDSPQNLPALRDEERESHNMKERKRRARIKEACDLMRQLVPGMSDKTDKATVFEFSARYIYYLKNYVGSTHDKSFLVKYSPY